MNLREKVSVVLSCLLLIVCSSGAEQPQTTVVLKDGARIEAAKASVKGRMVYVTLPNGSMRGYDTLDVDLEASGLIRPEAEPPASVEGATIGTLGGTRLEESSNTKRGSGIVISDADVAHIVPPAPGELGADGANVVHLSVSNIRRQRSRNVIKISGQVTNSALFTAQSIVVNAAAFDTDGKSCGQRSTSLQTSLAPGQHKEFALEMAIKGEFMKLDITARGIKVSTGDEESESEDAPDDGA